MHPALYQFIKQQTGSKGDATPYQSAKAFRDYKISFVENMKDLVLVIVGVLSAGFGLKGFLLPNDFFDGGAMGIALILDKLTPVKLPYLVVLVNLPFVIFGYTTISKIFSLKTISAIIFLALATAFFPYPVITSDKLLVAVFGGFFLGMGIGFAVRGGCVIDGTEVMAIQISRRSSLTIGDVILVFNIIIFSVVAYVMSIEVALYSILTYLAASKTVDFIIEGIEEYTGVTIISAKHEAIRKMIITKMGRGVTIYKGESGYGKRGNVDQGINIIYTVVTRLEVSKLSVEIEKIDRNAFVVMSSVKDTKGGMIKKRPLSH